MSEHTPKFLAVHFDGDHLEHAALADSETEAEQISCRVRPGDHWDMVVIPIQTAAAAPDLLDVCRQAQFVYDYAICRTPTSSERNKLTKQNILRMAAIDKANKET